MAVKEPRKDVGVSDERPSELGAGATEAAPPTALPPTVAPPESAAATEAPVLSAAASAVLAGVEPGLLHYVQAMEQEGRPASQAARVVEEVVQQKPQLGAPHIAKLVKALLSGPARATQAAAACLPLLAKTAPAKVARHLELLREGFGRADEVAKDGMVRVFVALCLASVAYQRRVIDMLEIALSGAEPKQLVQWTELALPALKGEPHAQARDVVEKRLPELPRPQAQRIADFLGVKLRLSRP
jgi:hypothetical protein